MFVGMLECTSFDLSRDFFVAHSLEELKALCETRGRCRLRVGDGTMENVDYSSGDPVSFVWSEFDESASSRLIVIPSFSHLHTIDKNTSLVSYLGSGGGFLVGNFLLRVEEREGGEMSMHITSTHMYGQLKFYLFDCFQLKKFIKP